MKEKIITGTGYQRSGATGVTKCREDDVCGRACGSCSGKVRGKLETETREKLGS